MEKVGILKLSFNMSFLYYYVLIVIDVAVDQLNQLPAVICFLFRHMGSWSQSMLAGMTLDRMDAEASLEVSSAYQ